MGKYFKAMKTISREAIETYFRVEKIRFDENILTEAWRFLLHVSSEINLYKKIINEPDKIKQLRENDKDVINMKKAIAGKFENITSITINTKKGSFTFTNPGYRNAGPLFGIFLDRGKMPETFKEQMAFLKTAPEFDFPFKLYSLPDRDQHFRRIVECSLPFAKKIYRFIKIVDPKKRKAEVKRIITSLLSRFYPSIASLKSLDAMDKDFKKYLFPHL
jgi:hypothetical protein